MELILQFWPVVVGFIALVAWLVRLEARAMDNTKEIKRLWNQRKEDLDAAKMSSRISTNKMLAEIRDDIKALIAKVGS
jgi:guanylate kinase